ncbi:MAG: PaaI family thioesterase [Candidatus Limnocylindrales bacterium]
MDQLSLQERYAPHATCFGCGPANPRGLRIRSRPAGDEVVATWQPGQEHEAFAGALNGGIVSTLLDCHSNWAAIHHLIQRDGLAQAPATVTAELRVRFLRPTPTHEPVTLRARVVEAGVDRATVEATVEAGGRATATGRATFVVVEPGHPAYHRWE